MYAGVPGDGDDTQKNKYGLPKSHAYTLLSAHYVYNADGSLKARLFRCRNPWGSDTSYTGAWRDDADIWTDTTNNYASQLPYAKNTNDGIFFIDSDQFQESFGTVQVFFWDDNYVSTTSNVWNDQSNNGNWFSFTLD